MKFITPILAFLLSLSLTTATFAQDILPTIESDGGPVEAQPVIVFGADGEPVVAGANGSRDQQNTTAALLGAGEEFTGAWVTNGDPHIGFNVLSDQPGTLFIEFSPDDGSTVTLSKPYAVFSDQANFDALVKGARAHRIRYVNGDTAQGSFALVTFTGDGLYPYAKSDRDEPHYFAQGAAEVAATQYQILVDLSDNVNFPHYDTGRLDVYAAYFQVDRDTNGAGAVRLGVITRIDGTDADIAVVLGVRFEKSDSQRILRDRAFNVPIKLGQSGGELTKAVTSVKLTNIAAVNTGITLPSPRGPVTPAVGDMIAQYERTAGTYDASIAGFYAGSFSAE